MTGATILPGNAPIQRRAMFVLELVDPATGIPIGDAFDASATIETSAEPLHAPNVTRAGQIVWLDVDPAADRSIKVSATARADDFAPFGEVLAIARRADDAPPTLVRRMLQPTGLYRPPAGRLAAIGMLIDDAAQGARNPIAGATVVLVLAADALGAELRSTLTAVTDARGGFVAVAAGFGTQVPQPIPSPSPDGSRVPDGSIAGRLEITWLGAMRAAPVTLQQGRLNHLPEPIAWAGLT